MARNAPEHISDWEMDQQFGNAYSEEDDADIENIDEDEEEFLLEDE